MFSGSNWTKPQEIWSDLRLTLLWTGVWSGDLLSSLLAWITLWCFPAYKQTVAIHQYYSHTVLWATKWPFSGQVFQHSKYQRLHVSEYSSAKFTVWTPKYKKLNNHPWGRLCFLSNFLCHSASSLGLNFAFPPILLSSSQDQFSHLCKS